MKHPSKSLSFSHALEHIKKGKLVQRKGWKDLYVVLANGNAVTKALNECYDDEDASDTPVRDALYILDGNDDSLIPYTPSQDDLLAEDWELI